MTVIYPIQVPCVNRKDKEREDYNSFRQWNFIIQNRAISRNSQNNICWVLELREESMEILTGCKKTGPKSQPKKQQQNEGNKYKNSSYR